ncbi:unnamed protein product [Paramecium pentaurelia]|uniref:Uncharacterized protein n=1 Tax=Paramecium pentaurelia TaxID=43138 RepID=A0A8S1TNS3_9CILI|nr:unnamed protein product [Paramecium pentaurelia]
MELAQGPLTIHSQISMMHQEPLVYLSIKNMQLVIYPFLQHSNNISQQHFINLVGMNQQINVFHEKLSITLSMKNYQSKYQYRQQWINLGYYN